jgi:hypothetical protein
MKRLLAVSLPALAAMLALGGPGAAKKPGKIIRLKKIPHLVRAKEIVQGITWRQMKYRHASTNVSWKGVAGKKRYRSYADCSSFMNELLKLAYGLTNASLKQWLQVKPPDKRPLAKHYFQAIKGGNKFARIKQLQDAKAGDLIAIQYLPGDPDNDERNSGHVLLVAARPSPRKPTPPRKAGMRQWEVQVIDQSNSGHGNGDNRYGGKDQAGHPQYKDGLGQGVFRLYTDKAGNVTGHTWSTGSKKFYDQEKRPLLIGRPQLGR